MSHATSRRRFLETAAITGAGFWIAGDVRSEAGKSPNGQIAFAGIGVGGAGWGDLQDAAKAGHVVAVCDIDGTALNKAGQRFPKAKRYTDFRKMLDEVGKSIDAVTVSTPDHSHAPAALMAMQMGKHCFCQKPLTRTIYESRLMARVAREMKVATQMGNRGTAVNSFRQAAAVVKSGVLGVVKEVHVWTDRPDHWRQGGDRAASTACPPHVAWDLWLGPAPLRPYAAGYHPFAWHGWWDFGTGALGDMGCHTANLPYMALDLRAPTAVQAETSGHNGDSYPKWSVIAFEFPARNGRPALKLFWYDGGKLPSEPWMAEMKDLFRQEVEEWRKARKNYLGGLRGGGRERPVLRSGRLRRLAAETLRQQAPSQRPL